MSNNSIYENGEYLEKNSSWHLGDSPWKAEKICQILRKNSIEPRSIAEVGCGAGGVLKGVHERLGNNPICAGYDISPQAVSIAKQLQSSQVNFFNSDFFNEERSFDLVLAIDVFEHVEDYIAFLRKIKLRSKYNVFHIPLDLSVQSVARNTPILGARSYHGHLHYFTKETALATIQYAGHKIIDVQFTKWCFELPDKRLESKLMWLPRMLVNALSEDICARVFGGFSLLVLTE